MTYTSVLARACTAMTTWIIGSLISPWPADARSAAFEERAVAVGGIERSYMVHIPPRAAKPTPIVLIFHGGGGRPQAIASRTGMNDLADHYGFIAVYPAGADRASGRGGTWNIGGPSSPSSADDVGFVEAILGDLERTTPIDHARIYATGVSMGGVFSYRLACEMSNTFAAIAPVAATMVDPSCHPSSPVAVLHIHGTDDDRIPLNGGRGEMTAARPFLAGAARRVVALEPARWLRRGAIAQRQRLHNLWAMQGDCRILCDSRRGDMAGPPAHPPAFGSSSRRIQKGRADGAKPCDVGSTVPQTVRVRRGPALDGSIRACSIYASPIHAE
jgi:poly(3-hydroxybutyrate) depolymerase